MLIPVYVYNILCFLLLFFVYCTNYFISFCIVNYEVLSFFFCSLFNINDVNVRLIVGLWVLMLFQVPSDNQCYNYKWAVINHGVLGCELLSATSSSLSLQNFFVYYIL